ncbi:beta-1,6-N-acetylglucosaminyltransferase [Sporolactobacillus vineae]|uniref:beta-1,6-N-acetylglucosaminyltransferase n=1 Tax=Sporolactobacillus vineae TaxID=444463 RepID=UPI0002881645|nr:beta-1,6-N-acetylglucosaminyltransferase [Sporolactobacillus vineae]
MITSKIKMAYAIQCHKNSGQINELIKNLNDENIDFFIHVDNKSNIAKSIVKRDNVFLMKDRINVTWSGFSQVEATLGLLKMIRESNNDYDYVHLLSGQDFPIKSRYFIGQFFKNNLGKNFIEYEDFPIHILQRIKVYYPKLLIGRGKIRRLVRGLYWRLIMKTPLTRKIDFLPRLYYGSSWFSITGECAKYILNFVDENKKYYNFFKNSFCSDETFFQTIILNSIFKTSVVNNNYRYIDWYKKGLPSPKTLTLDDYNKLSFSDDLYARKFDADIDNQVIGKIEDDIKV